MKASKVQQEDPTRAMMVEKSGTHIMIRPVNSTSSVRRMHCVCGGEWVRVVCVGDKRRVDVLQFSC